MLPYRWANPYSVKILNTLRSTIGSHPDEKVQSNLNGTLKPANYQLYYRIKPTTATQIDAFNAWFAADSLHNAFSFPLDSVVLFPHLYTDVVLEAYEDQNEVFYTTVPLNQPLPSGIGASLLDTLYVPDPSELVLDFMLNLVSANFSSDFVNSLEMSHNELWKTINEIIDGEFFIMPDPYGKDPYLNGARLDLSTPDLRVFPHIERATRLLDGGGGSTSAPSTPLLINVNVTRGISFEDNTLNINEGIKKLHVRAVRFTGLMHIEHYTTTNSIGQFSLSLPRFGYTMLHYTFRNNELLLKSIDMGSHTAAGVVYDIFNSALRFNLPAHHLAFTNPSSNINSNHINFDHGSKKALWGIIYNGIQEANDLTNSFGMRTSQQFEHLDVIAYYRTNANNNSASAPMFKRMGLGQVSTQTIFSPLHLAYTANQLLAGGLPDIIITGSRNNPDNSHDIRHTIYHEYGHSLHFFRVDNAYWNDNINATLSIPNYGNNINEAPGNFFALTEGWADYIGHLYAFHKYGTPITFNEWNPRDQVWNNNRNYLQHLEEIPTYFNDFIPRGLFYDLTDGPDAEDFDEIQGFTTNDIYQKLNPTMTTIQQFRDRWETDHPDANNADLFIEYQIQ